MAQRLHARRRSTLFQPYQWFQKNPSKEPVNLKEELPSCCNKCFGKDCWWKPSPIHNCHSMEFCRVTSFHGLKYVGQIPGHFLERIFWIIAFIFGIIASVYLTREQVIKYLYSPVTVSFTEDVIDIGSIPFPAVTICNVNNVRKSVVMKFLDIVVNGEKNGIPEANITEAMEKLVFAEIVCEATAKSFSSKNGFVEEHENALLEIVEELKNTRDYKPNHNNDGKGSKLNIGDFLGEAAQKCSDMMKLCLLRNMPYDCKKMFKPVVTDFGKCCTFNMIPQPLLYKDVPVASEDFSNAEFNKWVNISLDMDHLVNNKVKKKYVGRKDFDKVAPFRVQTPGMSNGITVVLNPELEEHFCTAADSFGFHMTVHPPIEFPHVARYGDGIGLNTETFVKVKTDVTKAHDGIRPLDTNIRNCYFSDEKKLAYIDTYTAKNCYDECFANYTFDKCKCRRYYMPQAKGRRLCNHDDKPCLKDSKDNDFLLGNFCTDCLPTCNDVIYVSEMTWRPLREDVNIWEHENKTFAPNWDKLNLSILHVYFGEDSTYPKIRERLFGITELLASVGSLLGLCLGFSALSAFELLYFIVRRIFGFIARKCRMKQRWEDYQNGISSNNDRVIILRPGDVPFYGQMFGHGRFGYGGGAGMGPASFYPHELVPSASLLARNGNLGYYYRNY